MIRSIQYLRFFAAFIVVIAHSGLSMYGLPGAVTDIGGFGVDLFFVISGFIMPFIIYGPPSSQPSPARYGCFKFLWLRISRIWPMYFVATMAVVLLSYMVDNSMIADVGADFAYHFNGKMLDPVWLFESLTFTHGLSAPVLGLGWTLQVEFIFYSSIAALLLITRTRTQLMIGLVLVFAAAKAGQVLFPGNSLSPSYSNPMLIEFAYGFAIYSLLGRGVRIPTKPAIAVLVLAVPLFLFVNAMQLSVTGTLVDRPIIWGSIAFSVVYAAISIEHLFKPSRLFELLGDSSYSLYLVHYTIVPVVVHYWVKNGLNNQISAGLYLLFIVLICHAVAVAMHLLAERPVNKFIRRLGSSISGFAMRNLLASRPS